jgi:hypothetical protein
LGGKYAKTPVEGYWRLSFDDLITRKINQV